jgi:pyruvate kinase
MIDIIATIGPASRPRATLRKMVTAGMTIARINTKHARKKECMEVLKSLEGLKCRILFDVKSLAPLEWIRDHEYDYLAVSFAESAAQIRKIRGIVGGKVKIIAKIETGKGVRNIDSLIKESNGIMVARGDLGRNVPMERVPILQKIITKKCNRKRKMSVTATEMLLSMTKSRIPERAEVSDVANAILDGSDALMLSEETAVGRYPVLVVKTMRNIITETQRLRKFV